MESKRRERKKLTKAQIRTIIVAAISAVIAIALIITNFFVPVKYLTSYMVVRNKGAAEGTMRVRFVNVGYGDCTIIELPDGKTMLIDAGNGRSSNQSRILKYLNRCDINTIDYLICTSVNSEHCGGLSEILQYRTVNTVYMPYCSNVYVTDEYANFTAALKNFDVTRKISEYGAGEENTEYGYFFKFLSPSAYTSPDGEYAQLNSNSSSQTARDNASAVLWLQYGETGFLFTSDAGSEALTSVVNSYRLQGESYPVNLENCTVVKVANHGGQSSACAEFYDLINAEIAVISVGENAKGCPSLDLISDLRQAEIYRTDEKGTVTIEVTKDGYQVV